MQTSRPDLKTARIVDEAIRMIPIHGTLEAAMFMSARGVQFRTVVRTISGTRRAVRAAAPAEDDGPD